MSKLAQVVTLVACISAGTPTDYIDWGFREFPQFLLANAGRRLSIRPRPLPLTSFPIHYPLIVLQFDTEKSELSTASLNKFMVLFEYCNGVINTLAYLLRNREIPFSILNTESGYPDVLCGFYFPIYLAW
jgi:hypothetical protein